MSESQAGLLRPFCPTPSCLKHKIRVKDLAKVPQLVSSRAGSRIQSDRAWCHCSASSFVCLIHVKELCLMHVSIPIANTGNESSFPSSLSNNRLCSLKQTPCLASRRWTGFSQGPRGGLWSFSVISKREHQLTLSLSVYFRQGSRGGGQGRANVFRKQSISRTWHIFRVRSSTVSFP